MKNLFVFSNIYTSVNSAKIVWFLKLLSMQLIHGKISYHCHFTTPDGQITADNTVGLIDAFVDKLELQ